MSHCTHGRIRRQQHQSRANFAQQLGLPFADLLPDDTAERLGPADEPSTRRTSPSGCSSPKSSTPSVPAVRPWPDCSPGSAAADNRSFTGAVQTPRAFGPELSREETNAGSNCWTALWTAIATHRVGNRPDRVEPRAIKCRRRDYPALTRPRNDARQHLFRKM